MSEALIALVGIIGVLGTFASGYFSRRQEREQKRTDRVVQSRLESLERVGTAIREGPRAFAEMNTNETWNSEELRKLHVSLTVAMIAIDSMQGDFTDILSLHHMIFDEIPNIEKGETPSVEWVSECLVLFGKIEIEHNRLKVGDDL